MIPYARHWLDEEDVAAVVAVLRSDWLTTGPAVEAFEEELADLVGARHAVAVSSGTAALHAALHVLGVGPGDEVVVPAMTFVGTANAAVFLGATPVFCDVDPDTLLLDPNCIEERITSRTRAVVAVDYAGQPCDYRALRQVTGRHGLALVGDACHSLGAEVWGERVGTLADVTAFSFHPVKHVTTGEGGMIVTDRADLADRARRFRNHGLDRDHRQRAGLGTWSYEMHELGYNYRISDLQCALGRSQLRHLPVWLGRRRALARRYDQALAELAPLRPLAVREGVLHAYHLYVVELDPARVRGTRGEIFAAYRAEGIGVNVHYLPAHLHPFYQKRFGTRAGSCPVAETAYERILSLPLFPRMTEDETAAVLAASRKVTAAFARTAA